MKKLKLFIVALAMVSLACCNFGKKKVIRYEVNAENPACSYVAEIIPGVVDCKDKKGMYLLMNQLEKSDKFVMIGSCAAILESISFSYVAESELWNVKNSDEIVSWVITYPEKRENIVGDWKQIYIDFINNAGISVDTSYADSYKLNIIDNDKFEKVCDVDKAKNIDKIPLGKVVGVSCLKTGNDKYPTMEVYRHKYENGVVQYIDDFKSDLKCFHNIPLVRTNDESFINKHILIKPEFYSEPKSVEEVNEMLSEYGLSLFPTGEEMMVVTFGL